MSNHEHSKFEETAINILTLIVMLLIVAIIACLIFKGISYL